MERSRRPWNRQEPDTARHPINHVPLDRLLQKHIQDRQNVVDGLWRSVRQLTLQPLNVFTGDLVQLPFSKPRNKVNVENRLLGRDAAWLLAVRPCVSVKEPGRE